MKGSTNATRGAADVVQNTSKIAVLDQDLQVATDSQPGIMSSADHATLSTTVSRMGSSFVDVDVSDGKMTFTKADGSTKEVDVSGLDAITTDLLVNVLDVNGSPASGATIMISRGSESNNWDLSGIALSRVST